MLMRKWLFSINLLNNKYSVCKSVDNWYKEGAVTLLGKWQTVLMQENILYGESGEEELAQKS